MHLVTLSDNRHMNLKSVLNLYNGLAHPNYVRLLSVDFCFVELIYVIIVNTN